MEKTLKIKEYNDEPILYCEHCLSLAIIDFEGLNYCSKCGSTSIKECSIEDWEIIYRANNNNN